ncbi:MAG: polyprenyl diphosphate synthase [Halieaceae bacterium]|jgi:undecaprenyl diphosphate synthase
MNAPSSNLPTVPGAIPRHVAIIMDGNSRWAKQRGLSVTAGHRAGVEAVRAALEACQARGVEVLTLFAFSSENWGRPEPEVRALLALFSRYLRRETDKLNEDNIRLKFIGRRDRFSPRLCRLMERCEGMTENNTGGTLVLAVDYGGHWDITNAVQRVATKIASGDLEASKLTEHDVEQELSLAGEPALDLCIRTGGDHRVSNFLLWQLGYAELFFTDVFWPAFDAAELDAAIAEFGARERRFGARNIADLMSSLTPVGESD